MRRSTIIGVIVLMSISLLGVVGLQLYWIKDAIKVKEEQFGRSVHDALAKVVAKLETQEAVSVVAGRMAGLQEAAAVPPPAPAPPAPPLPETPAPVPSPKAAPAPKSTLVPAAKPAPAPRAPLVVSVPEAKKIRTGPADIIHINTSDSLIILRRKPAQEEKHRLLGTTGPEAQLLQRRTPSTDSAVLALLHNHTAFRSMRAADSMVKSLRFSTRGNNFSADSLQHLLQRLDSMRVLNSAQLRMLPNSRPPALNAIVVQNDTILIYDKTSPVTIRHQERAKAIALGEGKLQPARHATGVQPKTETKPLAAATKPSAPTPKVPLQKQKQPEEAKAEASKVEAKKDKLNEVVKQLVVEYIVKDVPLKERLNLHKLNALLKAELAEQGIGMDFGYWVVSGRKDTIAAYPTQQAGLPAVPNYKVSLFPSDIYEKPDYLAIYFPDSKTYAIKSLWLMLLLSSVFTLIIMLTFGTTIYIIFRQKKISEMKNDFINNMTHEFKTPIATISLATDSIANPKINENPEKIKYYNNIIREENKRMNAQVENVLQIALLEKNEFKMNLQPVDVHALVLRAVERIKLQVEQRAGTLTAQLHALHHELRSDEVHLYNAICNLLDNANKYSPSSPDIKLSTHDVAGGILIAVEDKGLGMSKETQQRVFEKFYRVPTGNIHNVKGFGLGLSYVKAIVQAHRGHINLKSEPGKGSRFEIFLPFGELN